MKLSSVLKYKDKGIIYILCIFLYGFILCGMLDSPTIVTKISYVVLILTFAIYILKNEKINSKIRFEDFLLYSILIYLLISIIYAPDITLGFNKAIEFIFVVAIPYFIAREYFNSRQKVNTFLNLIYIISVVVSIIMTYRFIYIYKFSLLRFGFFNVNPIPVSTILCIGIIIGITKFWDESIIYKVINFVILFCIFLTGSRSALLVLIVTLIIYNLLFNSIKNKITICLILLMVIFTLSAMSNNGLLKKYLPNYKRYAQIVNSNKDQSINERITFYKKAVNYITRNPFFGIGLNGFTYYHNIYPHNIFLEVGSETGLIGLALFCSIFIVGYMNALLNKVTFTLEYKICFLIFIGLFIQAQFSYSLDMHKNLFVFYALLLNFQNKI